MHAGHPFGNLVPSSPHRPWITVSSCTARIHPVDELFGAHHRHFTGLSLLQINEVNGICADRRMVRDIPTPLSISAGI